MLSQPPPRRASLQSPSSGPCRLRLGRNALPAVEAERWQRKTETLWGCKSGSIYIYTHTYIMLHYDYIHVHYVYMYIYMHTLCVYIYICIHYVYIYICIHYVYIYIYAYIMCIYIHIHIHYVLYIHTSRIYIYIHTSHTLYLYIHITYIMYIYIYCIDIYIRNYPIFIHKSDFFHSSKLGIFQPCLINRLALGLDLIDNGPQSMGIEKHIGM